jgi:hypothetical protein
MDQMKKNLLKDEILARATKKIGKWFEIRFIQYNVVSAEGCICRYGNFRYQQILTM